ncbi:MAG: hypothetical protein E7543_05885 [Ruminococcaceae bacterium]|nr:hypothetical protein [Oscillospiraceae bacterium]
MKSSKKLNILSKTKKMRIKFRELSSDISSTDVLNCKIELRFNKEAIIDECKGVLDYSDTKICLNVVGGVIVFEGAALSLQALEDTTAIIKGTFTNISFET